jgi:hypothetical protein
MASEDKPITQELGGVAVIIAAALAKYTVVTLKYQVTRGV